MVNCRMTAWCDIRKKKGERFKKGRGFALKKGLDKGPAFPEKEGAKAKRCRNPKRWHKPKSKKRQKREKEQTRKTRERGGDVGKADERGFFWSVSNGLSEGRKSPKTAKAKRCRNPKRWTPKVQKERKGEKEKNTVATGKKGWGCWEKR